MNKDTIDLPALAAKSRESKSAMAIASSDKKNRVLAGIGKNLRENRELILEANRKDLKLAEAAGLSESLLERLSLQNRFSDLSADIDTLIGLKDPVGTIFDSINLPNGLRRAKMRVPIGVLGVIYESRPNVTIDVGLLSVKSGNCAILRGGSETLHSNMALVETIRKALKEEGLPPEAVQLIESTDRAHVEHLLKLDTCIDLIIPRGSNTLQQFCRRHSSIPVITGGIGICHLYLDESALLDKALKVIVNAKIRRPTVCNSLDTLLVHHSQAALFIPEVIATLQEKGVKFKLDELAFETAPEHYSASFAKAIPSDWDTEWLNLTLGIKVVQDIDEAIRHIEIHSTRHSDGILTENKERAAEFVQAVDSAAVYVNASTCFTDGGQFGLGGEVAISTQKLHARGPMGLEELTSYKWILSGDYLTRP